MVELELLYRNQLPATLVERVLMFANTNVYVKTY